jgi:ABC-type Zn uptake system ZnuABC Zn-binding protein ZnuA
MKRLIYLLLFLVISCSGESARPVYVATSHPVYEIIRELAGSRAEVVRLVEPGDSPHTYAPKPSEMFAVEQSMALFFVSENSEPWAHDLPAERKIALIDMLPDEYKLYFDEEHKHHHDHTDTTAEEHNHEASDSTHSDSARTKVVDPHFWTDPIAVKAILPALADTLAKLDPDHAATYRNNAQLFEKRLDLLDRQAEKILRPHRGKPVFLFHPSFRYMLKRYGLKYMGAIEPSPGKEPSPKAITKLISEIKESGATAIFTEPQLPDRPAEIIAEEAIVNIYEVDPVGGVEGRLRYPDLILYNAKVFAKALR